MEKLLACTLVDFNLVLEQLYDKEKAAEERRTTLRSSRRWDRRSMIVDNKNVHK